MCNPSSSRPGHSGCDDTGWRWSGSQVLRSAWPAWQGSTPHTSCGRQLSVLPWRMQSGDRSARWSGFWRRCSGRMLRSPEGQAWRKAGLSAVLWPLPPAPLWRLLLPLLLLALPAPCRFGGVGPPPSMDETPRRCRDVCRNASLQVVCLQVLQCGTADSIAVRPVPPNRNRSNRATAQDLLQLHSKFVAEANHYTSTDLLFLGDSITESYRGTDFDQPCRDDRCAGIHSVFSRHFPGALAHGIAADETQHLLWRLQHGELGRLQPRAVVLLIGTNNFGIGQMTSLEVALGIAANVEFILQQLRDTKVLVLGLLPRERHGTFQPSIQRTNRLVQQMCQSNPRLTYLDCTDSFLDHDGRVNHTAMPDLLHPSATGVEVMFSRCLKPVLQAALGA
eukprot:GGOE01000303.1.p1 GENE.GGOE01000303.1~~GGOE01000303.1.p1  ORF type:complete len:392 (-),score=73.81 GGOE01000303.1:238-1413(-)